MVKGKEFIKVTEVIPIHIERYNRHIARLLAVQDYSKEDLQKKHIDKKEYYRTREQKIRAYNDCINTMLQKEKILQYHNTGFQLELIEEKIEIRKEKATYDIEKLTFDEQVELLKLIQKAKKQQACIAPITINKSQSEAKQIVQDVIVSDSANIDLIEHEVNTGNIDKGKPLKSDPIFKLRESLNKIAANRFKEAGSTLDRVEEALI